MIIFELYREDFALTVILKIFLILILLNLPPIFSSEHNLCLMLIVFDSLVVVFKFLDIVCSHSRVDCNLCLLAEYILCKIILVV